MSLANDKSLYIDLMKRCLTNWIYPEAEYRVEAEVDDPHVAAYAAERNLKLVSTPQFDAESRSLGKDWPPFAHTMIGMARLENIQYCVEQIVAENIAGDFLEAGVWRGGASIFMRSLLKAHGIEDRMVWVADSFEGLPAPDPAKYPHDEGLFFNVYPELTVTLSEVQSNFEVYGLLDHQVRFVKGWFKDTLPHLRDKRFALLRLDGDLYESTINALENLYPALSPGGYIIIDDYNFLEACRAAVQDYRSEHGICDEILEVDWTGAYWKKSL